MVSYVFFIGCKSRTNNGKVSILVMVFELKTVDFKILKLRHFEIGGKFQNFLIQNSKIFLTA